MGKRKTTEEFISDARKVHGGKYSYSKVDYINNKLNVIVTCPIHGDFEISPNAHLSQRQGCPKCGGTKRLTYVDFCRFSRYKHGDKYDYSKVEYKNNKTKVCIICPEHGEFWMKPLKHFQGQGCPKCVGKYQTTEGFVKRLVDIFGNAYDYSNVQYVGSRTRITLVCPIHGDFQKTPHDIITQHQGCPHCQSSSLEKEIKGLLENNEIEFEQWKKFDWLGKQSLDFYLPKLNIAIECQGIQHFEPRELFGGIKAFERTVELDENKAKLCKENNVRLLYYSNLKREYPYEVFEDKNKLLQEIVRI